MKTCPNCHELNGNNRTDCWKCKTPLGPAQNKKICSKCGFVFSSNAEFCDACGARLSVYTGREGYYASRSDNAGCWMYVLAVLIPLAGIILGCIYIARREDDLGKSLIITSIVSHIIVIVLGLMLSSCLAR